MNTHQLSLIEMGLARVYRGRLIPIMKGGAEDETGPPLFPDVPEDFADLGAEELESFIEASMTAINEVRAEPSAFVNEEYTVDDLRTEMRLAVDGVKAARAALAALEVAEPVEVSAEDLAAELEELAAEAAPDEGEAASVEDGEETETETPAEEPAEEASIVAAAVAPPVERAPLPRPPRSRASRPQEQQPSVSLVASAGALSFDEGAAFGNAEDIALEMIKRRGRFGSIGRGTSGEKIPIAHADWKDLYPSERRLGGDELANEAIVAAAVNDRIIREEFEKRVKAQAGGSLTASGGLCAPVTPYYNLQMISIAQRPVRAALAAFNADRGGMRYARPAALSAVTTGVGVKTAAQDAAGGTDATKTCQVVACPEFQETDVQILFHCLQFGNLGARTFPERVAQWNALVLAAHARLAESELLTGIDTASTQVTATALGLGASATLFSQILAAANGLRNRNRMDPNAVLRLLIPWWAVDLIVSDVIRSQFQRFDTDQARVTALLRSFNIEPSFYIDGANGRNQVFDVQDDGPLLPFPENVVWYLYPEGSFLFLDGGTLELGLVRDSVLNKTNDFQIFGETFENVAFVGVESLAVETPVCDSGTVSAPFAVTCPIDYGD